MDEPLVLGRAESPRGEVVLRRRDEAAGPVHELVVNGVFAMDSTETSSERDLAALARVSTGRPSSVLVGGLGLGYTAAEVLADPAVGCGRLDVVELEPHLLAWARAGLTPVLARVAEDPRTHLHEADVAAVLQGDAGPTGPWDAILLDVDNGPDFLIHAGNAGLYTRATLLAGWARLAPGGVLAVWCQGAAPGLLETMRTIAPSAREHRFAVRRGERAFSYVVCSLTRDEAEAASSPDIALGENDVHG